MPVINDTKKSSEEMSFHEKSLTWLDSGTWREISQIIIEFSLTLPMDISLEEMNWLASMVNSTSRIGLGPRKYSFTTFPTLISHNLRKPLDPPERKRLELFGWNFITPTTWSSLKTWVSEPLSTSINLDVLSYPQESIDSPCFDHFTSLTAALW